MTTYSPARAIGQCCFTEPQVTGFVGTPLRPPAANPRARCPPPIPGRRPKRSWNRLGSIAARQARNRFTRRVAGSSLARGASLPNRLLTRRSPFPLSEFGLKPASPETPRLP